jgi:hypothetical protein
MDYCHCAFVGLSEGQHTFKAYDGSEHGRVRCLSRCEVEREVAAEFTRTKEQVFQENLAGAAALVSERDDYTDAKGCKYVTVEAEQAAYRKGWQAGERLSNLKVAQLRDDLASQQVTHQARIDGLKAQFALELRLAVDAASKGAAVYAEDLDMPEPVRADRAATQALLDKPYWAEGIDPDEP